MTIWKSYRAQYSVDEHRILRPFPAIRTALKHVFGRLELRHVRHATFEQLSSAGYDVRTFDDGAMPIEPKETAQGNLPESWKRQLPVIKPKIATLRDAVLFMDGAALLPDGRFCPYETSWDPMLRSGSRGFWNTETRRKRKLYPHHRGQMQFIDPITDSVLIRRHLRSIEIPGRCFSMRSCFYWNFGHFIHDNLARIYYEDLGAIVPGRDKVIAPIMPHAMQNALFRKIFESYEFVQVPPNVPLRVEELMLPANLCTRVGFNPAAISALARRMRRIIAAYAGKERRKICITRRDALKRRSGRGRDFANVEDYEIRMRKLGFDLLEASAIDPEEQFAIWANTTDIVGIHGAGMMNMIMMPTGGNYTEIAGAPFKPNRVGHTPSASTCIQCAMAAGHRATGISSGFDPQDRPTIDIERLEAELSRTSR